LQYTSLGRTGVMVSKLCLGTMNFGSRTAEETAINMINQAIDAGVNFIDTANLYGEANEGVGRSEEIIGKALAQNGKRHRIVLGTKVFFPTDENDPNARGLSRRHIFAACEASLKRLRTDYVDLYQLHRPAPQIPIDETLRALDDLIHAGKVRYIGTSQFFAWQIVEALWTSERLLLNRFVTEQPFYNMIDRSIETDIVPMAQKYGIAILPYSPLGGGILTGKYRRGVPYPEGSRFTFEKWAGVWDSDLNDRVYELLDVLDEIAKEKGCTVSQLSLAWVMAQPGITSVIIGPRTEEQLLDNLGAINVRLNDSDYKRIDGNSIPKGILK
jgi:aryl-alcohol dehydrogenase-like predicted oxidoreductase